jgi:hypothetical protein
MDHSTAQFLPILVPLLILAMILRRSLRARSLKMERLWIYPVLLILLTVFPMASEPAPGMVALAGFIVAIAVGGVVGWYRGRLTNITINPETHEFASQASIAGTILIGVVFAARYAVRMAMSDGGAGLPAGLHLDVAGITQGLMLFLVGMVSVQRIEMFLRCQQMLTAARSGPG